MMEHQNYFLEVQVSVTVSGFTNIEMAVTNPNNTPMEGDDDPSKEGLEPPSIPLIVWTLRKRAINGSKLVTLIERGHHRVQFFCTAAENKEEAIEYIDGLESSIRNQFGYEVYVNATDGNAITRKFVKKVTKNTGESFQALTQFLSNSPAT
eukprot:8809759-Ditylum_brightwellii.AAC.1